MLSKTPQKTKLSFKVKALVGIATAGELLFLGVSCIYFRKMHEDRDLRKKVYMNMPWFSKMYYDVIEKIPSERAKIPSMRQLDYVAWGVSDADN